MKTISDFDIKQRKYMPVFPMATGKATVYIEGYPYEDDDPMPTTGIHGRQVYTIYDQLLKYFADEQIYIGNDSFIYYSEGNISKCVAPDIFVVLGVSNETERRSFYTWAEGTVPIAAFEFLSDSTADQDRHEKVELYLKDIGIQEYFIHQPDMESPAEFRGWKRSPSGEIVELEPDAEGGLFSEKLNLLFRWEEQSNDVRLLRAFLPDGTPIATSMEEKHLKEDALERLEEETLLREIETQRRQEAETRAAEEALLREIETQRRQEAEAEIERLRAQLTNRQNDKR
ncbi:Uma2 family endonuclease [Candidatus Poribacteria bacterium]|nr:Uma2 family endonuclease [Candidatus Poribacteria bacterium]